MTHPIVALQAALVAALRDDAELLALIGMDAIFDAPPKAKGGPYMTIARHDLLPRDGDAAPGNEHRLLLHVWAGEASRKAALAIADRIIAVALGGTLESDLTITNRVHERTDTAIDQHSGQARAAIALRFLSEPGE